MQFVYAAAGLRGNFGKRGAVLRRKHVPRQKRVLVRIFIIFFKDFGGCGGEQHFAVAFWDEHGRFKGGIECEKFGFGNVGE